MIVCGKIPGDTAAVKTFEAVNREFLKSTGGPHRLRITLKSSASIITTGSCLLLGYGKECRKQVDAKE